jgi:SAM-dependent methyltransferase
MRPARTRRAQDRVRRRSSHDGRVRGYTSSSYGDAFADVYDDWYRAVSDVDATVSTLIDLASTAEATGTRSATVLELGVGTGRLALPLAAAGPAVTGVDASAAMLRRLAEKDPEQRVQVVLGDMVDDLPSGPFDVVFVAYNTLFNLLTPGRQRGCFAAVRDVLAPAGSFVVEAFVPSPQPGSQVAVRSLDADRVVLSISLHDGDDQRAEGHYVELTETAGVRLRPWSIRYATPDELDGMAAAAGLALRARWGDFDRRSFTDDSDRHVSVYSLKNT